MVEKYPSRAGLSTASCHFLQVWAKRVQLPLYLNWIKNISPNSEEIILINVKFSSRKISRIKVRLFIASGPFDISEQNQKVSWIKLMSTNYVELTSNWYTGLLFICVSNKENFGFEVEVPSSTRKIESQFITLIHLEDWLEFGILGVSGLITIRRGFCLFCSISSYADSNFGIWWRLECPTMIYSLA